MKKPAHFFSRRAYVKSFLKEQYPLVAGLPPFRG
jgi:hypothetical protein